MTPPVLRLVQGSRRLDSWIGGFMSHSAGTNSNIPFRRWTAIATVAAALERKVWIKSQGKEVFPNLYTFLVGPPGVGKTSVMNMAMSIFGLICSDDGNASKLHLARISLSKAALMDQLAESYRLVDSSTFNSLMIASFELGALIPNYDQDFLNALVFLYDCIRYDEDRRGMKEPLIIPKPVVNILAACTPGYLVSTMPTGAWDQGFLARVIVVFADLGDRQRLNLNEEEPEDTVGIRADLIHDIEQIAQISGKLEFERAAAFAMEAWYDVESKESAPTHPRLQHYNTRRPVHLLKLCIIAAVDAGRRIITAEDFYTAKGWLYEVEASMPTIFTAMNTGGDAQVMNDCWHWALTGFVRADRTPIPVSQVHQYLANKVPIHNVARMVDEMLRAGMLERTRDGSAIVPRASFQSLFK